MAITCTNYDAWIARWHEEVYRFCLVLVLDTKTAEEMTFQAFLRLGASPPNMEEASARKALYASAYGVSKAYYLKKLRRKPSKKSLQAMLGTGEVEKFGAYLRMPFQCRAAAFLLHIAAFSPEDAAKILGVHPNRVEQIGNVPDVESIAAAIFALRRSVDAQNGLSDRLYMRFSERSVAFETRMLDMRHKFDRIVPYVALFILILFACAFFFSPRV